MKKLALCSDGVPEEAKRALSGYADRVIYLPPHPNLAPPVASHADMILCLLDETVFFDKIYKEAHPEIARELEDSGLEIRYVSPLGKSYPEDVKLNVLVGEGFAAGYAKAVGQSLVSEVERSGREFLPVKQGYAACSCLLANGVLISADDGILRAASRFADTVKISPGGISLPPYDAGFIGGASGFDGERAVFFGDLASHPEGEEIFSSLTSHGVAAAALISGVLSDFGGIKFIDIK